MSKEQTAKGSGSLLMFAVVALASLISTIGLLEYGFLFVGGIFLGAPILILADAGARLVIFFVIALFGWRYTIKRVRTRKPKALQSEPQSS
jgi:hypothetical protein